MAIPLNQPNPNAAKLTCLSFVIPARNEDGSVGQTIDHLHGVLSGKGIPHEIVVVDDGSTDGTWALLQAKAAEIAELRPVQNLGSNGFGRAILSGMEHATGDALCVMMADESDDPNDAVVYWEKLNEGWDCVFGSRFIKGGVTYDYPKIKMFMNRIVNTMIRFLFGIRLNDTTNAFKAYRREVLRGCGPLISPHFNLTVEIPLKAIVRGYTWTVVPISWRNRKAGVAKLKLREMGSRYLFIILYCLIEKYLSRGDYLKRDV
jgi:dolichol-phosphate mannosyltransferase